MSLSTRTLTAVDAYPNQTEVQVVHLGSAFRSALSGLFEDSRRVDFLIADMIEGMFDRGRVFTVADMNRLKLALGAVINDGRIRGGRQARDAAKFLGVVLSIQPFSSDAFTTAYAASRVYAEGGR